MGHYRPADHNIQLAAEVEEVAQMAATVSAAVQDIPAAGRCFASHPDCTAAVGRSRDSRH